MRIMKRKRKPKMRILLKEVAAVGQQQHHQFFFRRPNFNHSTARHDHHTRYPATFDPNSGPLEYFQLFFPDDTFDLLVQNTNQYAASKNAGLQGGRSWKPTSIPEMKVFFGLIIYMGVFPSAQVKDYWSRDSEFPFHRIGMYLSQNRFEQLKRYFHISEPYNPGSLPQSCWYFKVAPLANLLQARYQHYFLPSSDVAVDEMMVQFTGRSAHTIMLRGKPTPQGYKILALCDHGYTYSFIFTSRTNSFAELNSYLYSGQVKLSPTSQAVYQLAYTLPSQQFSFTIYMDNYFSNIRLFHALRERHIGACGTSRPTSAEYPKAFKFGKKKSVFPLNTLSGVVCGDVLVCLWQDNNLVRFMSTVHEITPEARNFPHKQRRRPRITDSNRQNIERFFGNRVLVSMPTPKIAVDYNNKMNSVDLADQYRSYYATQLRVSRVWMPLFFWLLDTTVINSWILAKITAKPNSHTAMQNIQVHRLFRLRLAHSLIHSGYHALHPSRAAELENMVSHAFRPSQPLSRNFPGMRPPGNTQQSRSSGQYFLNTFSTTYNYCAFPKGCEKLTRQKVANPFSFLSRTLCLITKASHRA